MQRSCSSAGGDIWRGHDTPTRKNCGKVVATKTGTTVSRLINDGQERRPLRASGTPRLFSLLFAAKEQPEERSPTRISRRQRFSVCPAPTISLSLSIAICPTTTTRFRRDQPTPLHNPPRPQRWAAAVAALVDLQDEHRVWLDNLPASLEGSRLAQKLLSITELDLEELQSMDPPRGYGRD
jgi:hypothetical protein